MAQSPVSQSAAQNSVTQNSDTLQRYPLSSTNGPVNGAGVMVEHMQSAECFHADYQAVSDPAGRYYFISNYVTFLLFSAHRNRHWHPNSLRNIRYAFLLLNCAEGFGAFFLEARPALGLA